MDRNVLYASSSFVIMHLRQYGFRDTKLIALMEELLNKASRKLEITDEDIEFLVEEFKNAGKQNPNSNPPITLDGTLGLFTLALYSYAGIRPLAVNLAIEVDAFRKRLNQKP